ncbi:hypothetical protein POJ06DRAFT_118072 [Lipomyces tetrasporus]|uniref:Uncharacterized protein n=1 Tax=Lipomyces tetrasporus TaxID=54092 RepID=A0AAD7VRC1_9ASCO|nr:uncharacterized protein POJ06DRAFT_118072 [Lipomyces tetrasporus]KAJ8099847.1 hypothetical protein POJ06DRAFT_118072 [Lipomyces tetrasporus]
MSSSKLDKTLARVKQRIADHQFYEAHQALKTVAARYIKAQQYDQAIELLYHGAQELLTAGEGGSGGDLSCSIVRRCRPAVETTLEIDKPVRLIDHAKIVSNS